MIAVSSVPHAYVGDVWPHVSGFLDGAIRRQKGTFTVEAVKGMLDRGELVLWVMIDEENGSPVAAATTRIVDYPLSRSMSIDWVGGKRMKEWLAAFSQTMDSFAKDNGCMYIEGAGRAGWVKALAPFGYKMWAPTYRKDLSDE